MKISLLLSVALWIAATAGAGAAVPGEIHYQGRLTDDAGVPFDGNASITVLLYDTETGGSPVYQEDLGTVAVEDGVYAFAFGANGVGGKTVADWLGGPPLYLALVINGEESTPRTRILAVPYALRAQTSGDTEALSKTVDDLLLRINAPTGFVYVPEGEFQMGNAFDETEGEDDEVPLRTVTVDAFYMGRTEVTNDEMASALNWAAERGLVSIEANAVLNLNGSPKTLLDLTISDLTVDESDRLITTVTNRNKPCVGVTWFGAQAYCNFLSDRAVPSLPRAIDFTDWSIDYSTGGYRLPTEAEWERAARGGAVGLRYPWGNQITFSDANFSGHEGGTTDVGSYPPTDFGLLDMIGNVWEWVGDWYGLYDSEETDNPTGPTEEEAWTDGEGGPLLGKVVRGGNFAEDEAGSRVSNRFFGDPKSLDAAGSDTFGFRPVRPARQ